MHNASLKRSVELQEQHNCHEATNAALPITSNITTTAVTKEMQPQLHAKRYLSKRHQDVAPKILCSWSIRAKVTQKSPSHVQLKLQSKHRHFRVQTNQ
jgi:hypothetical protein